MSNCVQPCGLYPAWLLCSWDSLGKNTGVRCHTLLQEIFPTQGLNPCLMSPALAGRFFTISAIWKALLETCTLSDLILITTLWWTPDYSHFYKWGIQKSKKLSNLPEIKQLLNDWAMVQMPVPRIFFSFWYCLLFSISSGAFLCLSATRYCSSNSIIEVLKFAVPNRSSPWLYEYSYPLTSPIRKSDGVSPHSSLYVLLIYSKKAPE